MLEALRNLIDAEGAAAEDAEAMADPNAPLPPEVTVSRGHGRSKTLQIRLNGDGVQRLELLANGRGLPVSTVARSLLLSALSPSDDAGTAISRIENELATLERWAAKG